LEGSTKGNEDNFDDLDTVFVEKSEIKSETTSDVSENIDKGDAVQADASELDTNMEKSGGIEISTGNSQIQPDSQESDSKFFAIRTTGGQEHIVVNLAQNRINSKKIPVRSILLLDSFKGYIIIEAPKITRVDYEKQEATVLLLDSPYQIPVTVDANYLKKAS